MAQQTVKLRSFQVALRKIHPVDHHSGYVINKERDLDPMTSPNLPCPLITPVQPQPLMRPPLLTSVSPSNPVHNQQNRHAPQNSVYFSPYQFAPWQMLPHVSTYQVLQGIQAGEEFLPMVAPQLAHVTPLITVGYAGQDIYSTFTKAYQKTADLPSGERTKKIAAEMGDITLFHLLATFLIPLLIAKKAADWMKPMIQKNPYLPKLISKSKYGPVAVIATVLTIIAILIAKPVNKGVNYFLDVTYRPLVEKRKREKLLKELRAQYSMLR